MNWDIHVGNCLHLDNAGGTMSSFGSRDQEILRSD